MGKKSKLRKALESGGVIEQVAALPYRMRNEVAEFLVITSRRRKRLIVPKGWRMPGKRDADAAAIEADEEAGVKGKIASSPCGSFAYAKDIGDVAVQVSTLVFPLRVKKVKNSWKEQDERKRKWLTADQAALMLDDIGLRILVGQYASELTLRSSLANPSKRTPLLSGVALAGPPDSLHVSSS